jgi:hypothetical protein
VRKPWGARVPSLRWEEAVKKALEADGALTSLIGGNAVPATATPTSPPLLANTAATRAVVLSTHERDQVRFQQPNQQLTRRFLRCYAKPCSWRP